MKKTFQLINKNLFFSALKRMPGAKKDPAHPPLITISREFGSGGGRIGTIVAKKLKKPWTAYHKDLVDEIAKEAHLEKKLIREVDEGKVSLIEDFMGSLLGRRNITLSRYYRHLLRILTTIGSRGHAVIVGRGANFIFPHALKIRVIAPMDYRIRTIMKYRNLSEKEAEKKIDYVDRQRLKFNEELFRKSSRRNKYYDLVIQTGDELGPEEAADIIVYAAKNRFKLK